MSSSIDERVWAEVADFIHVSFKSVWSLELLLIMRRQNARAWTIADLNREMRATESLVKEIVADFVQSGLLMEASPGTFQYRPPTAAIERLVELSEKLYAERPIRVIEAVLNSPNNRVQIFAEAFRFRKG